MVRWKRDVLMGIAILIFCAIAFMSTFSMSVGTMAKIKLAQPGVYLRGWIEIFAALAVLLIVNAVRKKDDTKLVPMFQLQTIVTLVLLAAYIYLMDKIGFLVSTALFTTLIVLYYSWEAGKFKNEDGNIKKGAALYKSIAFYVVISLVVAVATQYVFSELLNVNLPTWKF